MDFDITEPRFNNEEAARDYLEARRWPNGATCPHCGAVPERVVKLEGEAHRKGLYQCNECHGQFSVTVGTLYERSHVPLHKWMLATHLMTSSKKGISAHQLHRMLGVTYKTAWFMAHRIREGLAPRGVEPMGGSGKVVEADETYVGGKERNRYNERMALGVDDKTRADRALAGIEGRRLTYRRSNEKPA